MHSNFELEWVKHRERRLILIQEKPILAQNASEAKKSEFLVYLDCSSKHLKYLRNFEKLSRWTKNSDSLLPKLSKQNSFPLFWAKLGYSQIKIDLLSLHVLYSLQFKTGVHLLNDELTQLPSPVALMWFPFCQFLFSFKKDKNNWDCTKK